MEAKSHLEALVELAFKEKRRATRNFFNRPLEVGANS
jgi:hypothetical protein